MSRRAAFGLLGAGLAVQLALLLGALSFVPAPWRIALAFAVLVLLPGAAGVHLGLVPPGGAWLAPMWAAGFGVGWNALLVLVTRALGLRFTVLAAWSAAATLGLWLLAIALRRATPAEPPGSEAGPRGSAFEAQSQPGEIVPPAGATLSRTRWALAAVLIAALLAALHAGRPGTPITYYSDSPDHIGTIHRMMASGDAFPRDAFFKDAGKTGVDPRKGLWHPQVALIARLANVEAVDAWRWASAAIAPLFILNAAAFGWCAAGARGAAAVAWAALLVGAGATRWAPLRKAVFSTFLADQLCFAAAIAWLADLGARTWRARAAAAALALSAVLVHLYSALQLAVMAGAYLLGLAARDRAVSPALRRAAGTATAMAAVSLPFALWRAQQSGAPANVIHTEPQGLLWLTGGIRVVSPGVLWDWIGGLWVLFPLAWWPLWRHGRRNDAALYLLSTSLGVAVVLFAPPIVSALEPRVGYLLMRTVWMLPTAGLVGLCLVVLAERLRARAAGGARGRIVTVAGLLVLAYPLVPFARDAASTLIRPGRVAAAENDVSPVAWRVDLRWMESHLAPGSVVLSDPATSYAVPMLSGHYVVSLVDQHSSPNDADALRRLLDARDALDPYASWARTGEVVRRYSVDAIVLNGRFASAPGFDYWAPSLEWYRSARARLDRHPEAFERAYDAGDFVVYRVRVAALDSLDDPPRQRPYVAAFAPGRFPIARLIDAGSPALHALALWPRVLAPGDTLRGVAEWRALAPLPPGSYRVAVRFDRALPGGFAPPGPLAKPARKVLERVRGELYRFRADHLPIAGEYGVDLWRPDEVVRDSFTLEIPRAAAAGGWAVEIKLYRTPHYPNFRLSDYFFDRDYFSGVRAGTIHIARAGDELGPEAPDVSGGH